MGEYAIRKVDGREIKIGTCENMYYLRFEDRGDVTKLQGNVDPVVDAKLLRFRVPFPDEDLILPGDYPHVRALTLEMKGHKLPLQENEAPVGRMQVVHKSGLLLSIPCHHGEMLPDLGPVATAAWNGRDTNSYELKAVAPGDGRIFLIVGCRWCSEEFSLTLEQIEPLLSDKELIRRLQQIQTNIQEATK